MSRGARYGVRLRWKSWILLGALLLFATPAGGDEASRVPEGVELLDMVDPAALYCGALGYDYRIVAGPGGERGRVTLPDGRQVDAWRFYRGEVGREFTWGARNGYAQAVIETDTGRRLVCLDGQGRVLGGELELMGLAGDLFAGSERAAAPVVMGDAGRELPASFDWRDLDGCVPIRAQGSCGSCWAFGTMAPLECNILIKDGVEENLSEQWLVSCNSDGYDCGGGWWVHDYHQWKGDPCGGSGAVLEADFPYEAADLPCNCPYPHAYWLADWAYIGESWTVPDVELIKAAIYEHGPVSVAVSVNTAFHDYGGGIFHDPNSGSINHAVALVGWNDDGGYWILRNSWGTGWGEDGYMRITYGSRDVGYNSCFVEYRDPLAVSIEGGAPEAVPAGVPWNLDLRIEELGDGYVAGSGQVLYRRGAGAFSPAALAPLGGGLFRAVLPAPACGDVTEYYVSVEAADYGTILWPAGGEAAARRCYTGTMSTVFADDFEADLGWSVENGGGLADGAWERGIPADGDRGDPPADYDGSGRCYVTDNVAGNSDVDDGYTRLISPVLDLDPAREYIVHYALWYTNYWGNDPEDDVFDVDVSTDGGASWSLLRRHGPRTLPGWEEHFCRLNDHVDPGSQIRLRFEASDLGDGSVVEAGLDQFRISELSCGMTAVGEGTTPAGPVLLPNVPNPFNPSTTIHYRLSAAGPVALNIHDLSGRRVRRLLDGRIEAAGEHAILWDGRDASGRPLASGVYFARLAVGEQVILRKMTLLK